MTASPTLTFFCPACNSRLTVPAQLAGVTGPCPTCGTVIQAPVLPTAPQYQQTAPPQFSSPAAVAPVQPQQAPEPSGAIPQPESSPHHIRVEPRQHRSRPIEAAEVVSRPMPEGQAHEAAAYRHPHAPHGSKSYLFKRILISLAAIIIMGAVSAGLFIYLSGGSPAAKSPSGGVKTVEILPNKPIPKPQDLAPPKSITPPAPQPPPTAPATPEPPKKVQTGVAAIAVLEKFLAAQSLAERLPLIETSASPAELENTPLAKPLPPATQISPDIQETNRSENFTDIYYNVDFGKPDGKSVPCLILLRAHAGGEPKVVASPFLDSYGGRLAAYAAAPVDKPGTFQVVAYAVAKTTSDQKIPNHEQKLWLKLLPRDNEKEIASAFFTKVSKIGQMLTSDSSGFRYGQARPVQVTLRWNVEEDPNQPFLEASDIKDFHWNP